MKPLPAAHRFLICLLLSALAVLGVLRLDFRQPFIGYGLGGAFLLFLAARQGTARTVIVSALGAAFAVAIVWEHFGVSFEDAPTLFVQIMGALGLASLLLLGCSVAWSGRQREPSAYRALLPGATLTFMILGAMHSLNMASLLHQKTLDLYAYAFDGCLGFQPSFELGRIMYAHAWVFTLVKMTYEGIVIAMAAVYAGYMRRREKPIWELIEMLFAPAIVGYLFFSVFPVSGPRYAFPSYFPDSYLPYTAMPHLLLERIPVPVSFPRNGVPSLHMTWALVIWLNTRGLPRWARAAALALVLATAFDTLATGEHYLFDLLVALPFTLSMQACLVRTVSFRRRERWLPALAGAILFLAWLAIGRFGFHWMVTSRLLTWALVAVSSLVSLVWATRLPAMVPEMENEHTPQSNAQLAAAR
jgi:hypothetical protein